MAKISGGAATKRKAALHKGTSQGNTNSSLKFSSMNKSKKRSFKAYRGQGRQAFIMIINIIGLPRTGTTVLYQSVFSGINKCDMLVKRDTFLDRWDEPWIFSKQDRGNPEFIKNLSFNSSS